MPRFEDPYSAGEDTLSVPNYRTRIEKPSTLVLYMPA